MKKISFSDVCDLTACVLRGEVTNKVMPVSMTLHVGQSAGVVMKVGPDDMTFYFNKEDVLCVEYEGKYYIVPKQSQPIYAVGETVAVAQCLKDLGYDANDKSDGHIYGLSHTLAWTMKAHVSASQCKHFVMITGRQVKRLQDITDEEILHSGVYRWGDMPDCPSKDDFGKNLYGFYKFWDGYETPREAYASMIDKTQKKGFWESNPWIVIYKFELTKEE
jgi:hypothetical protein